VILKEKSYLEAECATLGEHSNMSKHRKALANIELPIL